MKAESLTLNEYVSQLTKIAESTGYAGAMLALAEHYSGEKYMNQTIRDENKCKYWKLRAVRAGDINSIIEYYGFTGYSVRSDMYNDMIRDLDTARSVADTDKQKAAATYLNGVANYKMGKYDIAKHAKQLFAAASDPEFVNKSKYMTFQCLIQENNIPLAERILSTLEENKFPLPAADYLTLYNHYAAKRNSSKPCLSILSVPLNCQKKARAPDQCH